MCQYHISVIVAVYNVSKYLNECLESLHRQNENDVEFIVVDDGSTDGSSEICDSWAAKDRRFRIIHQENKGSLLARKAGVMQSHGQWIVFIDGDDMLAENALSEINKLIIDKNTDLINFTVDCFGYTDQVEYDIMYSLMNRVGNLKIAGNYKILSETFIKGVVPWVLWSKIYRKSLLEKVFRAVKDEFCISSEDAYMYFLCCYFANSFCGQKTRPLYLYRLNSGISTQRETLSLFYKHVDDAKFIPWIRDFLVQENALPESYVCLNKLLELITEWIVKRMSFLPRQDLCEAFTLLCEHNNFILCLPYLARYFYNKQEVFEDIIYHSLQNTIQVSKKTNIPVKTIGVLYRCCHNGSVTKVISSQIQMLLHLGYKVVAFVEQIPPEKENHLPSEVTWVVVPESYDQQRATILGDALREYNVDVFCHNAANSPIVLFDLLLCHAMAIKTIITCHETTACRMILGSTYPFNTVAIYSLADTVCVLSRSEEYFYQQCGVNARYLPNPIVAIDENCGSAFSTATKSPVVLWIGELENAQKNCKEALQIFKIILERSPNASGYMLGSGDAHEDAIIEQFIRRHGLKDRLIHIPYTSNISDYYRRATVHLVTSSFEAFPMTIVEGKLHALPLVTYEMPYAEVLKDGKGYISVPRHQVKEAAEAVLSILNDSDYAQRLSREARDSIQPFLSFDLAGAWQEIIEHPEKHYGVPRSEEEIQLARCFWEHTLSMYNEGCLPQKISIAVYCKNILKSSPVVAPLVNKLLPLGSQRREKVRSFVKYIGQRMKKLLH